MPTAEEFLSQSTRKPTADEFLGTKKPTAAEFLGERDEEVPASIFGQPRSDFLKKPDLRPNVAADIQAIEEQLPPQPITSDPSLGLAGIGFTPPERQPTNILPTIRRPSEVQAGLNQLADRLLGVPGVYGDEPQPSDIDIINRYKATIPGLIHTELLRTGLRGASFISTILPQIAEQMFAPPEGTEGAEQPIPGRGFGLAKGFTEFLGEAGERAGSAGRVPVELITGTKPLLEDIKIRQRAVKEPELLPIALAPLARLGKVKPTGVAKTVAEAPKPDISQARPKIEAKAEPFSLRVEEPTTPEVVSEQALKAKEAPKPIKEKFAKTVAKELQREFDEAKGQDILDNLEEKGTSASGVNKRFWGEIYDKLPKEVQGRFDTMLRRLTSFKPGSVVAVDKAGNKIIAKSYKDIGLNYADLPKKIEHLEGTERGFITLQSVAIEKFGGKVEPVKPQITAREQRLAGISEQALEVKEQMKKAEVTPEAIPKERIPTQMHPEVTRKVTAPTIKPIKEVDGRPFILNNENIKRFRRGHPNWEKLPTKDRKSWMKSAEEAVINRFDEDAMALVQRAVKEGRPLSAAEQAGAMLRVSELEPQWLKAAENVERLQKAKNFDGAAIEQQRANNMLFEMDEITSGMYGRVSQEVGRAMSIRRNQRPETISTILLAAEKAKGQRLAPKERNTLKEVYKDRENLRQKLEEMTVKWEAEKAKNNEVVAARIINRQLRGKRTTVKLEKSRQKLTNIEKQIQEMGFRVNDITGASIEALHLVGQYAAELAKIGELKFEGIVARVKEKFPDFSRNDVLQGIVTKDPKLQGKLRTDATKQVALLKRQAKLLLDIEKAEKGVFEPSKGRPPQPSEIRQLQRQLHDLRKMAYKSQADGAKLDRALRLINELQDQLKNQYRPLRKPKTPEAQDLIDARKKSKELRTIMRTMDRLADFNEQLRTGEFKIKEKPEPKEVPIELQRLQVDVSRKSRQIRDIVEELSQTFDPRTGRGLKAIGREGINLGRTLKATADMSAVGRQGLVPALNLLRRGEFKKLAKIEGKSVKAFFSEFTTDQIDLAIKNADHHYLREQAGLYFAERGAARITAREEFFMSRVAEKIPGWKHVVKASERHMTTSLNLLRAAMFDSFLEKFPNATLPELKAWADYVNVASGRGNVGRAGDALSLIFFAPRFAASRFQTPLKVFQNLRRPRVRNEITKDMAATIGFGMTALILADLAGLEVEWRDPSSPDWGKIRFGDTKIDIWAGFQQAARLIMRGVMGKLAPEEEFNPLESLWRFAGYKMAPHIQIANQLYTGRTIVGEELEPTGMAWRALSPIIIESTIEAYQRQGRLAAAVTGGLEFGGVAVQTFPDSEKRTRLKIKKLTNEGKETEAQKIGDNWNLLNPENRIVKIRNIVGADTTFIEIAKPKSRKKETFLRPATR